MPKVACWSVISRSRQTMGTQESWIVGRVPPIGPKKKEASIPLVVAGPMPVNV
jgi:hypothetical protein